MDPRDSFISEYTPWVKFLAKKIHMRLPPNVELDDLMQAGLLGLLDAHEKYDVTKGCTFKTYAEHRIRGAILDEVRELDLLPRTQRERIKQIENARFRVGKELNRKPTDLEVANYLGLSLEEMHRFQTVHEISIDDLGNFENGDRKRLLDVLASVEPEPVKGEKIPDTLLAGLARGERVIVKLYYERDFREKEIGDIFGVTESRISQKLISLRQKLSKTLLQGVEGGKPRATQEESRVPENPPTLTIVKAEGEEALQALLREEGKRVECEKGQGVAKEEPFKVQSFDVACF